MCATCRVHSLVVQSPTSVEAMRASFQREDTLSALVDHVLYKEHPAKEERTTLSGGAATDSMKTSQDAIAGIPGLIEGAVAALVNPEGNNEWKRVEY